MAFDTISFLEGYSSGLAKNNLSNELNDLIDEINGEIINGMTVTFIGADGSELCKVVVAPGYNCPNPVYTSVISRPTKTPTLTEVFSFSGWSLVQGGEADYTALQNVTADRTVYAAFTASTRYYTIRFYDGTKLVHTDSAPYLGSVEYSYSKIGHFFNGWVPEPTEITGDTDCYAQMVESNFSADSWETIIEVAKSGEAQNYYSIGDEKYISLGSNAGGSVVLRIAGFGLDTNYSGTPYGMTIIAKTALPVPMEWCKTYYTAPHGESGYTVGGFYDSDIHAYLNEIIEPALPLALRRGIGVAEKSDTIDYAAQQIWNKQVPFRLWIPSYREVTGSSLNKDPIARHYPIYATDDDRIATLYGSDEGVAWWTSSVSAVSKAYCITADGGKTSKNVYAETAYVVFGFCI